MEQSQARDILRSLRTELAEAHGVVAEAQRRVAALEKLVDGYVELFPGLAEPELIEAGVSNEKHPRGQDAVLRVMQSLDFKGTYWTVGAMVRELTGRNWLPETQGNPANAIRTALDRLAERDDSVHKGRGQHGHVVWYWQGEGYSQPRFARDEREQAAAPWPPVRQEVAT